MTLPTDWSSATLADFIVLQRGFDLPHRLRVPGTVKVLSSGEAHGWHNEARVLWSRVRGWTCHQHRSTNVV